MSPMAKSFDIVYFAPSDGLTPIQTKKLNTNFQRLVDMATGKDEGLEGDEKMAARIEGAVTEKILDIAYPVGTILFAKDPSKLPAIGTWKEVTDFDGRYLRIGGGYGETGGSDTQTVEFQLPRHSHKFAYSHLTDPQKIKIKPGSGDEVEVISGVTEEDTIATTNPSGTASPTQSISIKPKYVSIKLFERIE